MVLTRSKRKRDEADATPLPGVDYPVTLHYAASLEQAAGPWAVKHNLVNVKVSKKDAATIIKRIKPSDPDDAMLDMTYFGYPWSYLEEYSKKGGELNKLNLKTTLDR